MKSITLEMFTITTRITKGIHFYSSTDSLSFTLWIMLFCHEIPTDQTLVLVAGGGSLPRIRITIVYIGRQASVALAK